MTASLVRTDILRRFHHTIVELGYQPEAVFDSCQLQASLLDDEFICAQQCSQ